MGFSETESDSRHSIGRTYVLTRTALFTALVTLGRLGFAFLPNVQLMTVLIVCITLYYGWKTGLAVSVLSVLLSNIYLGMGPWTLAQIIAFSVLVGLTNLLRNRHHQMPLAVLQLFTGVLGMLYGLIISVVQAPFFGWNILVPYYLSGLFFDIMHAGGNIVFLAILYPLTMNLFCRMEAKRTFISSRGKKGEKNELLLENKKQSVTVKIKGNEEIKWMSN